MESLERNELTFLYKKCQKIRPWVISQMALVPEYMSALKEYTGNLDDESVYRIISYVYRDMLSNGQGYRTARDVVNKVSKDVRGDSSAWQSE